MENCRCNAKCRVPYPNDLNTKFQNGDVDLKIIFAFQNDA